jgi:hypothetical protein
MKKKMSAPQSIPHHTVSLKKDLARSPADCAMPGRPLLKLVPPPNAGPKSLALAKHHAEDVAHDGVDWPLPPRLTGFAYHGPIGKIVRAMDPHTEAEPVAILVQGLVACGNIIGSRPFLVIQGAHHHLNLNAVIVGPTSAGRKGTAWQCARMIFDGIDPAWTTDRLKYDLNTPEGLIHAVRDPALPKTGKEGEVLDPGVEDKRLLAFLDEFSTVFRRLGRLSPVIRSAWGHNDLQILTKHTAQKATQPHVSILGHMTPFEIPNSLCVEVYNGFANRFLWVMSRKSKRLPGSPGPDVEALRPLIQEVAEAVAFAKSVGEMRMSDAAAKRWAKIDCCHGDDRDLPPVFQAVTGRALPQMLRIAMLYALMDKSAVIEIPHLKAARVIWRYVEGSIRCLFKEKNR